MNKNVVRAILLTNYDPWGAPRGGQATLLENKRLGSKLGSMGKKRIMNEFNLYEMLNSFFRIYDTLLTRKHHSR